MKKLNLPTKLTLIRIVIAFIVIITIFSLYILEEFNVVDVSSCNIYFLNTHINLVLLLTFILFIIASLTDLLDGYLARKLNMITDLGKFLDPLADKILINSLMIFLCFNFNSLKGDITFPSICVVLMVVRDLIVDGLRFMAASKNRVLAASFFGKAKTVLEMVAISCVLLNGFPFSLFDSGFSLYLHISDFICYLATLCSIISGVIYLKNNKDIIFN